ncbi:FeoA family protein [Halococcoides cellulosivorans]|uniref:Ferrous iron transport protein A n=1 Tax=Halococcoides cellulosivorans TaxID=1679096 RepID=A0A2R4WZI2_9EURY|nr:FeoA family protein [Halococcoides cellulosivorans]AWB26956.1 ferrous iron transport protein A [Halococcoides cellulosivorans]
MDTALADADPGESIEMRDVPDDDTRARLLRLGFLDGPVECRRQLTNGPVILRRNGTELALGSALADEITIDRHA